MKKKNFLYLCTVILYTFLAVGCGAVEQDMKKPELVRVEDVKYETNAINIGFVQTGKESDWRDANTNDFLNTFTVAKGYNLIYVDGNSDPKRQVKAVYDLVAQNVDYIIMDPIVESGWKDALQKAKDKKIPVIVTDRKVDVDESMYTAWVGSDFEKEGSRAAQWLRAYIPEENYKNKKIRIVLLEGTQGATAAIGRTKGILSVLGQDKNFEIIARECGNFTQGEGKLAMEKVLKQHEEFEVLIAENDNMMFGAMRAMDEKNITYGPDGDVITISFDALHEAFIKMIDKELQLTVECNPLLAGPVEQVIQTIENGGEVNKINYVEEDIFPYYSAEKRVENRSY